MEKQKDIPKSTSRWTHESGCHEDVLSHEAICKLMASHAVVPRETQKAKQYSAATQDS